MDNGSYNHIKVIKTLEKLEMQINNESTQEKNIPHNELILSITRDTAKFLNILLTTMKADRVLEIGTSIGYSTVWFALGLIQNKSTEPELKRNKIITIENNPSKVKRAIENFEDANVSNMIEIKEGNALKILKQLSDEFNKTQYSSSTNLFDFVFLDADKENLTKYFDLVLPMTRVGGIIVTDNVLYPEEYRPIMNSFLNHIKKNSSIVSTTIPIGHGEEISLKINPITNSI